MRLFICVFQTVLLTKFATSDYWESRRAIIDKEDLSSLGGSLILDEKEKIVNSIVTKIKSKELDYWFIHPNEFPPANHFFSSKVSITKSETFRIIQKLPKGASLHGHYPSLASFDVLYNFTYESNLYVCIDNERLKLKFFVSVPQDCNWQLLSEMRNKIPNFDNYLKSQLSMVVEDPFAAYPDIKTTWEKFKGIFVSLKGLLCYKPVFREYFWAVLEEFYEDNVKYIEFRSSFSMLYDLSGTTYGPEENINIYLEVLNLFKKRHPDFIGAKVIYSPKRTVSPVLLKSFIKEFLRLKAKFPGFIAGFDLVEQEDTGTPLKDYVPELLTIANETKFFFHAGETDWEISPVDDNIIDAILLNSTRIGHGYGIIKHPEVLKAVMERQIAIEVNPISNQVLKLVDDLRNHPASHLIGINCPLVVCSDDPGVWGSKALSFDWYMVFLGMTRRNSDLRFLKQLAINSIIYSAMMPDEKNLAISQWKSDWDKFLDYMLQVYSNELLH